MYRVWGPVKVHPNACRWCLQRRSSIASSNSISLSLSLSLFQTQAFPFSNFLPFPLFLLSWPSPQSVPSSSRTLLACTPITQLPAWLPLCSHYFLSSLIILFYNQSVRKILKVTNKYSPAAYNPSWTIIIKGRAQLNSTSSTKHLIHTIKVNTETGERGIWLRRGGYDWCYLMQTDKEQAAVPHVIIISLYASKCVRN